MESASNNVTFGTSTCIFLSVTKNFSFAREGVSNEEEQLCKETSSCLLWVL